ncbi:MAG: hypothetical protein O8C66_01180 [Candidatus Methanoperedens sp.]|nr:hypothetical protein [Candidatus Methanoperedens sp.]MCZ7369100.1 hypothetical protein [Candidatus Methanoperedens sp.]
MSGGIDPFEHTHGADRNADAVALAAVMVQRDLGAVYAKLFRRLHFTSYLVAVVFARNRLFHKIRIYWNFPTSRRNGFLS